MRDLSRDPSDLIRRDRPIGIGGPIGDDAPFELVVQPLGPSLIAERVDEDGKRELRWAGAAVAPGKSCRGVIDDVGAWIERAPISAVKPHDTALEASGIDDHVSTPSLM